MIKATCSMLPTVATVSEEVPRTPRVAARSIAQSRARWATTPTPSRTLARHWGVSMSRARHLRTGIDGNPLATVLGMIADPGVDATPIIVAMLESYEDRLLHQPTDELRARYQQLREVIEHRTQAEQDRALMAGDGAADACRQHASVLIELSAHEEILGLTKER